MAADIASCTARARSAAFDERFTVVNLILDCLDEFIQDRRKAIRVRQEAALLSPEERDTGIWGLEQLEEYTFALKAENIHSKEEGMDRIRALLDQEANARKTLVQEVKDRLDRAFAFLAGCFCDGQEMILLVTALTRMEQAMNFISLYGCEPYLEYSQKLLYQEREQTLRSTCGEMLK
ncbi:MAG: hypothetical protein K2P04_06540 [Oscillospiraceae bacterium]|nr:hypothetical protein [Oscillospiraceae bacterium]